MSSMEAMLMGDSSSDSDGEDGSSKAGTQVTASTGASPKPPVVAAAPPPPQPGSGSKSDLTNRLKNLYGTSPPKGGPPKVGAPLPRPGGPPVAHRTGGPAPLPPGRNVAPPPNSGTRPGPMPPGHPPNYVPPMVHAAQHRGPQQGKPGQPSQPQQMQQQRGAPPPRPGMPLPQPPPTVQGTVGRVPAPLPKARTTHRSAPPSNRPVASVPMQGRGGAPPPSPLTSTAQQGQSRQYQQAPQQQQPPPQPQQMQQQQRQRQQQQQQMQQRQQQQQQQMQQRQQQQQQQQQRRQPMQPPPQQMPLQQQQQRPPSGNVTPDARSAASGGGAGSSANLTEAEKKEKERFLMFTRVLMKYLEQRDNVMHAKAKAQIKECYERNKQGDPEFRSLTSSMKARLRSTVGELYWKKAHDYLEHFLKQKKGGKGGQGQSRSSQQAQVQRQQPGQPPQQQAPSSMHGGAPPPIVRTAQPPQQPQQQQQHLMTQSQAAAAKKVPIASSSRPAQQPSTVPVAAPPATATAVPAAKPPATAAAKGKKGETDEERKKREKRNEQNRKKRAKRKMEKEAKEAAEKAKAEKAGVKIAGLPTGVGIQHPVVQTSTLPSASAASMTSSTASVTSTASSKAKEKKAAEAAKKKKKKPLTKAPSIIKRQNSLKQPNRLMDNVDHAVMIDVKTIPNLLSKEHKMDVNLDEEQRILLYGDEKRQAKVKEVTKAAAAALGAGSDAQAGDAQAETAKLADVGVPPLPWKLPAAYNGWGNKNVLGVRTAWAKVRLPEGEKILAERAQEEKERAQREKPMALSPDNVSGGVQGQTPILAERAVSSGSMISKPVDRSGPSAPTIKEDTTNHVWYNETRAEQDPTLAMLSEATESFLKSAIENAIGKARLRQNLDGVRLWHTLHAHSVAKSTTANGSKDADNDDEPPPALIRLGCDVRRQIALAEGNAAKTYQRMEEAISRQNDIYRSTESSQDPDAMLLESTSMADLSRKPPLKSAAQTADLDAKRKYAVFGGSESQEPPLGRVPKKARVTLQDIVVGEAGNRTSMIRARRKRFRVGLR